MEHNLTYRDLSKMYTNHLIENLPFQKKQQLNKFVEIMSDVVEEDQILEDLADGSALRAAGYRIKFTESGKKAELKPPPDALVWNYTLATNGSGWIIYYLVWNPD